MLRRRTDSHRTKLTRLVNPCFSVVIPTLDEEVAIGGVVAGALAAGAVAVVVVDGGSSDRTVERAQAAGASVVHEPRRGYGRACKTGADATSTEVIAFMDGDGSDDPAFLSAVVGPVLEGDAALLLGARTGRSEGALFAHQYAGTQFVVTLLRVFHGVRVTDIPPLRAIRRDALEALQLREMTYGWPTEMIVRAARIGLSIGEVPVVARARMGGTSKIAGRAWPSVVAGLLMIRVAIRTLR
jgi:glycosyltransferase involved in cell wall biosynthesis